MLRVIFERNGETVKEWPISNNDYEVRGGTASISLQYEYSISGKEHLFSLDGLRPINLAGCQIDDPANYSLCYGYRNGTTDYNMLTYDTATSTEKYLDTTGWVTAPNATTIKSMYYQAPVVDKSSFFISTGYTE